MDHEFALPTIFSPDTLVHKGLAAVSRDRAPSTHNLYYEVHGAKDEDTTERVLFIMGLNTFSFSWLHQLVYFASLPGYQVAVFDNRGVGNSDTPTFTFRGRFYKTSEMALDTLELLDHLKWTVDRSVHLVGCSMGGMIAQHCALFRPTNFASLCLVSTKSGYQLDLPPLKGFKMFAFLSTPSVIGGPSTAESAMSTVADTLYPATYLSEQVEDDTGKTVTRREQVIADMVRRYRLGRKQTVAGRIGQMAAVITHRLSKQAMERIAANIPAILIVTGDQDNMIHPQNSELLHNMMPGSDYVVIQGGGHALPSQCSDKLNALLLKEFEKGAQSRWN